jgi:response regulator of citrate/malate metabolism
VFGTEESALETAIAQTSAQLQLEFLIHRTIAGTCLNYGELATISKNRLANARAILSN